MVDHPPRDYNKALDRVLRSEMFVRKMIVDPIPAPVVSIVSQPIAVTC